MGKFPLTLVSNPVKMRNGADRCIAAILETGTTDDSKWFYRQCKKLAVAEPVTIYNLCRIHSQPERWRKNILIVEAKPDDYKN